MNLSDSDFELLGVPATFAQDREVLDARWKQLMREIHPDRVAAQGPAAQRVAMQWSVRINEAYQRLKDPERRAAYLCELHGQPVQAESNTAMPAEFLQQQLQWREEQDEASGNVPALQLLRDQVIAARARALSALDWLIDEKGDYAAAVQQVRALMFIERFAGELMQRLERLEQPRA